VFDKFIPEKKSEFVPTVVNSVCVVALTMLQPKLGYSTEALTIGCSFLAGLTGAYLFQRSKVPRADIPAGAPSLTPPEG
jgi:hypothetical protein